MPLQRLQSRALAPKQEPSRTPLPASARGSPSSSTCGSRRATCGARAAEHGDARTAPLALPLIDVDQFKHSNDSFGHDAGDDGPKSIVGATRKVGLRPSDLLARYGGEAFAGVLCASDRADAPRVAERVRAAVAARRRPSGTAPAPRVSISIGAAVWCDARTAFVARLIQSADEALYAAKNGGRNRLRGAVCGGTRAVGALA